jgi:hypothetical protein
VVLQHERPEAKRAEEHATRRMRASKEPAAETRSGRSPAKYDAVLRRVDIGGWRMTVSRVNAAYDPAMPDDVTRFRLAVPGPELDDLRARLRATRSSLIDDDPWRLTPTKRP